MGMDPISLGLAMGGASMASSLLSGVSGASQQRADAQAKQAQARQMREQARLAKQQGHVEMEAIDKQRSQLRNEYETMAGQNNVALGSGNVDLSSGSAMRVAEGNAQAFASDTGESAYQKALRRAEVNNNVASMNGQANMLDAQASYQKRTASNLAPTLIGSLLNGAGGFMTGYSFGGKLGASAAKAAGQGKFWDRALRQWVDKPARH